MMQSKKQLEETIAQLNTQIINEGIEYRATLRVKDEIIAGLQHELRVAPYAYNVCLHCKALGKI
jgi:hypothetical protein